jgi:leucyl/phenylalanyl-tRNA--protein transferase
MGGTWISEDMIAAYRMLHQKGYAHSFEAWHGEELVGGLYGVAIGRVFFGESMFHRATDASKVAFAAACGLLDGWGYQLIDCQVHTSHLESLGASSIDRAAFCDRIEALVAATPDALAWKVEAE